MDIDFKYKVLNKELEIENNILMEKIKEKTNLNEEYKKENRQLKEENEYLKNEYEKLSSEMERIIYSRSYKIASTISKKLKRR